jgi:hypothetical protein
MAVPNLMTLEEEDPQSMHPLILKQMWKAEPVTELRRWDLDRLNSGVKRLINPHIYPVALTAKLWRSKRDLVENIRRTST